MDSLNFSSTAFRAGWYLLLLAPLGLQAGDGPEGKVRFNRDIRPIMSDTCFHCHGFDPKSREAGMRLDLREDALKPTKNDVLPIVPGKPEESEIIARILSTDKDEIMPPPKAHKELTAAQKETFRRWVAEGAVYEPHWAYAPLVTPPVPGGGAKNPVDAFIQARLAEKGIQPSPEAPKAKLLRRLSLDLTGLPPTVEETQAFLQNSAPEAYEKEVDRLLSSPRFGERMAVWWLDIARFADTVGFHGDQNQRIFPYRDYVIDAFNANKPFDQFTIEQLAGDLLPNPTTEQLVATGYNRLNMMTREGGAQPKEYLAKYGAERVRAVSATWFGSTFGCAECHDHKFDPIKTADFYSLKSFFADVKQYGVYSTYAYTVEPELAGFTNEYPFPPEILVKSPYLQAQRERREADLRAKTAAACARLLKGPARQAEFQRWSTEVSAFLAANPDGWKALASNEDTAVAGVIPAAPVVGEQNADNEETAPKKKEKAQPVFSVTFQPGEGMVAALRISVPEGKLESLKDTPSFKPEITVIGVDGTRRKLSVYFADATAKRPRYTSGAELLGVTTGWDLPKTSEKAMPSSVWLLNPPPRLKEGEALEIKAAGFPAGGLDCAISPLASENPLEFPPDLLQALAAEPASLTPTQNKMVQQAWLLSAAPERRAFDEYTSALAAVRDTREGKAWTLVTQPMEPLTVRVLPRGNWQDDSGPVVLPSTPSFLPGRLESTPEHRLTRLDLARWLVSKENPITARAVMNRLWAQFFGTGLSSMVDDLGSQGELPSHPELLEWIASAFRDTGWNVKGMIRLMVTSQTYRQSSSLRPELREIDPANRLLASQNPRRLEAEFVRDNALFVSGALNLKEIGGPSVKPYQPKGYYEGLQFPSRDYQPSVDSEQWRRGLYMHWQRTFLHPMLANFDAPARDECAAQRTVSNTPQQALTLLNDPTFVEAARVFADRLLTGQAAGDEERIAQGLKLSVARDPKQAETASLKTFLDEQREYYRAHPDEAKKLLSVGLWPRPVQDPAETAAWTTVCRVLLNSQEVITRY